MEHQRAGAHEIGHRIRRHLLLRAHDTELWASYLPRWPAWLVGTGVAGVGLIAAGARGVGGAGRKRRAALLAAGLVLALYAGGLARLLRGNWRRRAALRERILDAVPWCGDERVLDVGCGTGMLLNGAAARLDRGGSALGIDLWVAHGGGGTPRLLLRNARAEGVAARVRFQEVDAREMPFDDGSFDVVLSSWALHHIARGREDFDAAAAEMLRVLAPGGTMVILDTAHMIEAIAGRMERAGLATRIEEAPYGQQIVVGRRPVA